MLNRLKTLVRPLLGRTGPTDATARRSWCSDPLSHPDLQSMSLNQLADLPFEPARIDGDPDRDVRPRSGGDSG